MAKKSKAREQFYKAYQYYQYPDVIHVKKDSYHSDIVCLKEFGSAYMEVVKGPQEDTEIYVKLSSFVKYATRKIGKHIDYLKDDMNEIGTLYPGEASGLHSSRIESLHTAIGTLICLQSEIEKEGMSKLDSER